MIIGLICPNILVRSPMQPGRFFLMISSTNWAIVGAKAAKSLMHSTQLTVKRLEEPNPKRQSVFREEKIGLSFSYSANIDAIEMFPWAKKLCNSVFREEMSAKHWGKFIPRFSLGRKSWAWERAKSKKKARIGSLFIFFDGLIFFSKFIIYYN